VKEQAVRNAALVRETAMREAAQAKEKAAFLASPEYLAQCLAFLGLNEKTTPSTVENFIGQDTVKTKICQAYETAKQNNKRPPHILLIGSQGSGKSALALLIARAYANSSGTTYKVASAKGLNKIGDLAGLLTNLEEGDVFFIDDIDQLDQAIAFYLRSAAVDFKLDIILDEEPNARSVRLNLPRFTLIATATNKSELSPLLIACFPVVAALGYYNPEEITGIARKLAVNMGLKIDDDAIQQISSSAGDSPSAVLFLLELVRVFAQARQVSEIITMDIVTEALKTLPEIERSEQGREAIPSEVKREVWRRDGGRCARCGSQEKLEYDHIIPVSKGGSSTARNIQLLCEKHNREKSDSIE
jgi:Holliday junction DNA helicase RuvB